MFGNTELTKPNFYKDLETKHFFPEALIHRETKTPYEDNLFEYVATLKNLEKLPEDYPDSNPLHPFLEKSGSLRTEVPMPETAHELITLFTIILGNKDNTDTYSVRSEGFQNHGFMDPALGDCRIDVDGHAPGKMGDKKRQILVWEDACGTKTKIGQGSPNFYILLCSILLQVNDKAQFGIRGRYGEPTMQRLRDGFAHQRGGLDANLMLSTIWINKETGVPYGFYNTGFYQNSNSLFLNFTFLVDRQPVEIGTGTIKPTSYTVALSAAYYCKHFNIKPENLNVVIHTDKMLAALSTAGFLKPIQDDKEALGICQHCFNQISAASIGSEEYKKLFRDIFPAKQAAAPYMEGPDQKTATRTSMIYFVDQSTVPPFDPGEEVPNPKDLYYQILYKTYTDRLGNLKLAVSPHTSLINGCLSELDVEKIASSAHKKPSQIVNWLQQPNSLKLSNGKFSQVISADRTISENYNINSALVYKTINLEVLKTELDIGDPNFALQVAQKACEIITYAAKAGNTGNQEITLQSGEKYPRLTEIAIFMVGRFDYQSGESSITNAWARAKTDIDALFQKKRPQLISKL